MYKPSAMQRCDPNGCLINEPVPVLLSDLLPPIIFLFMKVLHTEISTLENRLLHIERISHPLLLCRFHHQPEYHAHPELELLYVEKGSGTRIINGKEEPFTDGDMVFLGPNVPHIWTVDTTGDAAGREDNNAVLLYLNTGRFERLFRS